MDDFTSGHYVAFSDASRANARRRRHGEAPKCICIPDVFSHGTKTSTTPMRDISTSVVVAHSSKAERHRVGNNYTSTVSMVIQQQHVQSKTRISNPCAPFFSRGLQTAPSTGMTTHLPNDTKYRRLKFKGTTSHKQFRKY